MKKSNPTVTLTLSDRRFFQFIEDNDWEGEIWITFLPLDGNEDAVRLLQQKIEEDTEDGKGQLSCFSIQKVGEITEWEIDVLTKYTNFVKLDIQLDLHQLRKMTVTELSEALYKGGISRLEYKKTS